MNSDSGNEFEKASNEKQASLVSEFMGFLKETRKFWLIPLIIVLLALGSLLVLTNSALAPFIYTLF
ncbi:MAG: hypothetical protein ACI9MB_004141 [Verrucomicrobiales bacterium]|jgi:hypothetical protein